MAYSYSLGVVFNTEVQAKNFKIEFEKQKFQLKDSSEIRLHSSLRTTFYDNSANQHFAIACYVEGMTFPHVNLQLFEAQIFYSIRNLMYDFLLEYSGDFNYALYELEAADRILSEEMKPELKAYGIGKTYSGDANASYCSGNEPKSYYSKRLLDGLIVSESIYPEIQTDFPEFPKFKNGYYWLPIPNYKN